MINLVETGEESPFLLVAEHINNLLDGGAAAASAAITGEGEQVPFLTNLVLNCRWRRDLLG